MLLQELLLTGWENKMAGINKVIIMGYLGRNPELAYTQGGTAKTALAVATSRKKQDGEEITSWHRCTAW